MEKPQASASAAWSRKGKVTRRERFLAEMDAMIIAASSSTKNATGSRDPEMRQTRKGKN